MDEGDRVVLVPLMGGGYASIQLSDSLEIGDRVILINGIDKQKIAVKLGVPEVGDRVLLYPIAGGSYACISAAQMTGTNIIGWGDNTYGQLDIPEGLYARRVSAGTNFTAAIKTGGYVVCWGDNTYGQCTPPEGLFASEISAGKNHCLAITTGGSVVAWGDNTYGQCDVPAGLVATKVCASDFHNIALTSSGHVVVWGNNPHSYDNVPEGLIAYDIAIGSDFNLAVTTDHTLIVWNYNTTSQYYVHPTFRNNGGKVTAYGQNCYTIHNAADCVMKWTKEWNGKFSYLWVDVDEIDGGGSGFLSIKPDGTLYNYGSYHEYDGTPVSWVSGGANHYLAIKS